MSRSEASNIDKITVANIIDRIENRKITSGQTSYFHHHKESDKTVTASPEKICDEVNLPVAKAVAQRCSVEKVLLEISQNAQENTCARVSFPSTIDSNNTFIKSSNSLNPLPNIPPPKSVNPIKSSAHQPPTRNVANSYSDVIMPNKKDIVLFADSILRGMKMKAINSKIKRGKIHLKSFPGGKSKQLNHYVKLTLDDR